MLADTPALAQIHHWHHQRPRDRHAGSGGAGCHRHGQRADVAGHARDRHLGERRLHPPAAAVGCLHDHVSVERIRHRSRAPSRWLPAQSVPLSVEMGPAALSETVNVVASRADVLTDTAQVGTNFTQAFMNLLPTGRDLNATLLMAPAVRPSGPGGNFSINGARLVREPVPRQRRHAQREHPRHGARPLHRGRGAGNHRGDGGHLRRVRALHRRRRERHHEVGRQQRSAGRFATRSTTTTGAR